MSTYSITAESVTEGHPDKVADLVSDSVLDAILAKDPVAHVDCETLIMQGMVVVTGQITTQAHVNIPKVVRQTLKEIGLDNAKDGLDWATCGVVVSIEEQSPDIAIGVDEKKGNELGAGDQGFVFGYACRETPELMPLPTMLAHKLVKRLAECRKSGVLPYLRPDGKSQVTVDYVDGKPKKVSAVVIAAQHSEKVSISKVRKDIEKEVIRKVIPKELLSSDTKLIINGTGRFTIGGTLADSGLTGRKTVVDGYGSIGKSGGGCFSGKDPTKVDRSGAYYARYIAKNVVASGLADICEVQIAYAIGKAEPVGFYVNTQGTGKLSDDELAEIIKRHFDMRPGAIIKELNLRRPIYRKTAAYGHFGRTEPSFTWEKTDKAKTLSKYLPSKNGSSKQQ
ncbi:MAG: methionine adenosyltransferase [Candidatus Micrarchaeia archaeon]